jgi:hypothetical protein
MNVLANPGIAQLDFELLALAVVVHAVAGLILSGGTLAQRRCLAEVSGSQD